MAAPNHYDFAAVCADAILLEHTNRVMRGDRMVREDVVRIIRTTDAARLDRLGIAPAGEVAAPAAPAPRKPAKVAQPAEHGDPHSIPPEAAWVTAYSASVGYPLDGRAWCAVYEQKGWMVGKTKMKNWQSAVINWRTNDYASAKMKLGPAKTDKPRDYRKF